MSKGDFGDEEAWDHWRRDSPAWLNDLLHEQVPGRYNANFRLEVRKWWWSGRSLEDAPAPNGDAQGRVLAEVLARVLQMRGGSP